MCKYERNYRFTDKYQTRSILYLDWRAKRIRVHSVNVRYILHSMSVSLNDWQLSTLSPESWSKITEEDFRLEWTWNAHVSFTFTSDYSLLLSLFLSGTLSGSWLEFVLTSDVFYNLIKVMVVPLTWSVISRQSFWLAINRYSFEGLFDSFTWFAITNNYTIYSYTYIYGMGIILFFSHSIIFILLHNIISLNCYC